VSSGRRSSTSSDRSSLFRSKLAIFGSKLDIFESKLDIFGSKIAQPVGLSSAVQHGMSYLGICAGAFLAGRPPYDGLNLIGSAEKAASRACKLFSVTRTGPSHVRGSNITAAAPAAHR